MELRPLQLKASLFFLSRNFSTVSLHIMANTSMVLQKKPSIIEAVALNLADNTDAKMETFTEILDNAAAPGWQGYNKFFETNIYDTNI